MASKVMSRNASTCNLAGELQAPANRPHGPGARRNRCPAEEALRVACGNAEKLGRLIMAPRAEVDSGERLRQSRTVGDRVVGPLKDLGLSVLKGPPEP